MTSGSAELRPRSVAFSLFERRLAQRDQLLVAQLVAQLVDLAPAASRAW